MSQLLKGKLPVKVSLVVLVLLFGAVSGFFVLDSLGIFYKKTISGDETVTFNIPKDWKIYKQNKNYDFDMGYFKNKTLNRDLHCRVNATFANLNRSPTFEQFMETSLSGKMFIGTHQEVMVQNQQAWRGRYTFPSEGIKEPTQNDRVLFKWRGTYLDLTLSYSENADESVKNLCNADFERFLESIQLH